MTTVEIPEGSGNRYRYEYEEGATVYKGPVGDSPQLTEEEFLERMKVASRGEFEGREMVREPIEDEVFVFVAPFDDTSTEGKHTAKYVEAFRDRWSIGPYEKREMKFIADKGKMGCEKVHKWVWVPKKMTNSEFKALTNLHEYEFWGAEREEYNPLSRDAYYPKEDYQIWRGVSELFWGDIKGLGRKPVEKRVIAMELHMDY